MTIGLFLALKLHICFLDFTICQPRLYTVYCLLVCFPLIVVKHVMILSVAAADGVAQ